MAESSALWQGGAPAPMWLLRQAWHQAATNLAPDGTDERLCFEVAAEANLAPDGTDERPCAEVAAEANLAPDGTSERSRTLAERCCRFWVFGSRLNNRFEPAPAGWRAGSTSFERWRAGKVGSGREEEAAEAEATRLLPIRCCLTRASLSVACRCSV